MKKHEAKILLESLSACQHKLDQTLQIVNGLGNESEKKIIEHVVKNLIADILTDLMMPVFSQYPDLNPYAK